jgi:transcriptional regulator with XRE-family HTH domain
MQGIFISQGSAAATPSYDAVMHPGGRPAKKSRSTLGERLAEARIKVGLSQAEVAERMGTTQPAIAYWERGAKRLRSDVVARLSQILDVSADELLGTKARRTQTAKPTGRARQLFDAVSKLPRRQQEKVFSILEPFVAQHGGEPARAS